MKDSLLAALRERPTFVDLEKVHVGSPAIDLAHATLATSTAWHSDVGKVLSRADGQGFCGLYLENAGKKRAASLQPCLRASTNASGARRFNRSDPNG
jgi:hypothetical protein